LRFLMAHQHYLRQYLNVLRSSIASVFKVIHKDKQPLANQQLIQKFSQPRRNSKSNCPLSKKHQLGTSIYCYNT
jgi:hypothetical protein